MKKFLLEIGVEELPPFLVKEGEEIIRENFLNFLEENLIEFYEIKTFSTPRRWAIKAKISEKQKETEEIIIGPPKKIGIDENGNFLIPAIKFAESKGGKKEDLFVLNTEKGEYVALKIKKGGKDVKEILTLKLVEFIKSLKFPLMMNFGKSFLFPRRIKWILCLLDGKVLNFEIDGIRTGNKTKCNRALGDKWIKIKNEDDYEKILKENLVFPDFEERKKIIFEKAEKIATEKGGFLVYDEELLDELTGLLEYPGVLIGKFPEKYLEMPEDFIITAMRVHQRYFAIKDKNGKIMPYFITCVNNLEENLKNVIENFEKVLIARLEDAEFYMKEDLKIPLEQRFSILKEIYWDEKLGSVYDKVLRVKKFFEKIDVPEDIDKEAINRAIILSRTDLTTEMIKDGKEFTILEGIVASEYARIQGENEKVVKILREFLKPKNPRDSLPELKESVFLGMIDRWDTFIGYFLKGYRPTASRDPLGLKKILYGFFDLLINFKVNFSLREWINKMIEIYNLKDNEEDIKKYLFERYENYLEEKKDIRYDIVDATISSSDSLYRVYLKAYFLNKYYKENRETFLSVVIGQKRVRNILEEEDIPDFVDESIFEKEEEKNLYYKMKEIEADYIKSIENEDFEKSIFYLFSLKPYIDKFFDNVFVMTENISLRKNRLALLKKLKELFDRYADFSKISVSAKELELKEKNKL
jgi:glycyl-tRNA synthetase beta chain